MSRKLLAILVVIILIVALAIPIAFLLSQEEEKVDSDVRISEVMYDPFGDDAGQEWIELFNAGEEAQDLGGMTVINHTGEVLCTIADVMLGPGAYFVVSLSTGEDVLRNQGDEVAVSVGEMKKATIVDFICWSAEDSFHPGRPHDTAVEAGIWTQGDFFDVGYPSGNSMVGGFSMGRDGNCSDTDSSQDWARNGGEDAYFATPGGINAGPYFDANDGIKLMQTKANQFLLEWGYSVLDANHTPVGISFWGPDETFVRAVHGFAVDVGGVVFHYEGEGEYHWWRTDHTFWHDEISLDLEAIDGAPTMHLEYTRSYEDLGLEQTITESTLCVESYLAYDNITELEPPEVEPEMYVVEVNYTSSSVTTVTQLALGQYRVRTDDTRYIGNRGETQEVSFLKEYLLASDTEIEASTELVMTSDVRGGMSVLTNYTMLTDIGWHRVNDLGEMNVTYHDYKTSYGSNDWTMDGPGYFRIQGGEDHYDIDWSVPMSTEDLQSNNTMIVGGLGAVDVSDRDGEKLYLGDFTAHGSNRTSRYCIDGYESAIGGGICAIAGGLIGAIWVGVGAIIGGGIGAAACGAAGAAIESANEPDKNPPTIEFELGESGSNKDQGYIKVKIHIKDDVGLDSISYNAYSGIQNKHWSNKIDKDGQKSYTISRTYHNKECKADWRSVTVKATDTSGNQAIKSQQIRVPPRDCTPNVKSTTPADKQVSVPVTTPVVVEFCKPMNKTSAEAAISITPSAAYSTSWSSDDATITLAFAMPLSAFTVYTVNISTEAKSFAERPLLENYSFWFQTEDPLPPELNISFLPGGPIVPTPLLMADGTISDNVGVLAYGYWISNDFGFANYSTYLPLPVPGILIHLEISLEAGANEIAVWAVDEYGNYAEVNWEVTYIP